mmetsp:Transcript_5443/g.15321  ORF Transcript_5443/g.15321 Transcript_5443/m.15321 type:complete len:189 (-) Transcript_5443:367-933(-)
MDQSSHKATTFRRIFWLTCGFWLTWIVLSPPFPIPVQDPDTLRVLAFYTPRHVSATRWLLFKASIVAFVLYIVVVLTRLRHYTRQQDQISSTCGILEDTVVSSCCTCCTVAQLARHTGDYEHKGQRAACCAPTGLGDVEFYADETSPQSLLWHSSSALPLPNEEANEDRNSTFQTFNQHQQGAYFIKV